MHQSQRKKSLFKAAKTFFSSLMLQMTDMECLSMAGFFSLISYIWVLAEEWGVNCSTGVDTVHTHKFKISVEKLAKGKHVSLIMVHELPFSGARWQHGSKIYFAAENGSSFTLIKQGCLPLASFLRSSKNCKEGLYLP